MVYKEGFNMSILMNATVKYPSKEIDTKYGKRINVLLVTEEGEEIRQWGYPNDPNLTALKKNQKITILKDENDKYKIISAHQEGETSQTTQSNNDKWLEDKMGTLKDKAEYLIDFYRYCDKQVRVKLTEYESEESIRAITTTIFLQSLKTV
jgi:hypothetical protein